MGGNRGLEEAMAVVGNLVKLTEQIFLNGGEKATEG